MTSAPGTPEASDEDANDEANAGDTRRGNLPALRSSEIVVHARRGKSVANNLLLTTQLVASVARSPLGDERAAAVLEADTEDLYHDLEPRSGRDSVVARLIVATSGLTLDCLARAARTEEPYAREVNLKYGFKGASAVARLIEVYDKTRESPPQGVSIGSVNVEAGAQAIVGEIQVGARRQLENGQKLLAATDEEDGGDD
jgi:hypothetical protein